MPMTGDNSLFIDTNILVYAAVKNAPMHTVAMNALSELQANKTPCYISRQVLREFMCIMTRPHSFQPTPDVITMIAQVKYLENHMHVLEDDHHTTQTLLGLLEKYIVGGKRIHDANIVATMVVHEIPRLFTHNVRDFEVFSDLITVTPLHT